MLKEMQIRGYLNLLKTKEPVPGGGSVAGVDAAQGIALTLMVLDLTLGKVKYAKYEKQNKEVYDKALALFNDLMNAADMDKRAFLKLSECYKLPSTTEEEKAVKAVKIGAASLEATKAPYSLIEKSYEALKLTAAVVGKSNQMASSDLGVAAVCLFSASKGAWLNVKINLPYLADKKLAEKYKKEGKLLLKKIEDLSIQIYYAIEESL